MSHADFNLETAVRQATLEWKIEHDLLTFADIPLGEEFYDEDGNCWEKRSERLAMSWLEYERPEYANFKPNDRVRAK